MNELDEWFGPRPTYIEDLDAHVAALPDPEVDPRPAPVTISRQGAALAKSQRQEKASLLDPNKQTEREVRYVLCNSPLFHADLQKDGDYETLASGVAVFRKKTADYAGSILLPGRTERSHLYVEVKGISPGRGFALSRLTERNNPRQPSQHQKLTEKWQEDNLVWLALCFWDSAARPMIQVKNGREYTHWRKADCHPTIYLIQWADWLALDLRYKQIRQQDRHLLHHCRVEKVNSRWRLPPEHWFYGL